MFCHGRIDGSSGRKGRIEWRAAGPLGELGADAFTMGAAATALAHRIIFDDATGELFYDRDGTGAAPTVKFAVLEPGLELSNIDFTIID